MIQTIQVQGTEKRLYQLIAPLVMNPDVLSANNNYPFKTTNNTCGSLLSIKNRLLVLCRWSIEGADA